MRISVLDAIGVAGDAYCVENERAEAPHDVTVTGEPHRRQSASHGSSP
jgi:hypothetical protein